MNKLFEIREIIDKPKRKKVMVKARFPLRTGEPKWIFECGICEYPLCNPVEYHLKLITIKKICPFVTTN